MWNPFVCEVFVRQAGGGGRGGGGVQSQRDNDGTGREKFLGTKANNLKPPSHFLVSRSGVEGQGASILEPFYSFVS